MDFKKYGVVINRISDSEVLFKYSPIPYYKSFYEIAIPVVLEILFLAVELFVFGSAYMQVITIFILFCYSFYLVHRKQNNEDSIETNIVLSLLDDSLREYSIKNGTSINSVNYLDYLSQEGYTINGKLLKITFSNGDILFYKIVFPRNYVFLLNKKPQKDVSDFVVEERNKDEDLLKKRNGNILSNVLWIIVFFISICGWVYLGYLLCVLHQVRVIFLGGLCVLFLLFITNLVLKKYWLHHKQLSEFFSVVDAIAGLLDLFLRFFFIILLLILGFLFVVVLPSVVIFWILTFFLSNTISGDLILFLTFTIGSIFSAFIAHPCLSYLAIVLNSSNLRNRHYSFEFLKYVYTSKNIRFFVYFLYFVFLVLSGIMKYHFGSTFLSEQNNEILADAFLVFIAFSALIVRKKDRDESFSFGKFFQYIASILGTYEASDGNSLEQPSENL